MIALLVIADGLALIGVGIVLYLATARVGPPRWPWWALAAATAALGADALVEAWSIAQGGEPGHALPVVLLQTGGALVLLVGSVGVFRFMQRWYDDREQRFHRSIWSSLAEVYLVDPESGEVVDENRGASVLASDEAGTFVRLLVEGAPEFDDALRRAARSRERQVVRAEMLPDAGSERPRTVALALERTEVEGRALVAIFVQDLTLLREAEDRARQDADTFRMLIESVAEAIVAVDRDGRIVYGSPSVQRFVGRDPVGVSIHEFLGSKDRSNVDDVIARVSRPGASGESGSARIELGGDAPWIDLEWQARHVDYPGVGPCVLFSAADVSQRVERERRYRARQERIGDLFRRDEVVEGRIEEVAELVAAALESELPVDRATVWRMEENPRGIRRLDSGGGAGSEFIAEADAPSYFAALEAGRSIEIRDTARDRRSLELRESYTEPVGIRAMLDAPILVAGRVWGVLCAEHRSGAREWSADDVAFTTELSEVLAQTVHAAERRAAELEREAIGAQLRMSQRMETVGVLAGGIAHDFNNLLTPIMGYAELIQLESPGADTRASEILLACQRAASLVHQLLTFSRDVEAGDPSPVALGTIVEEAVRLIRASLPATVDIEVEFPDELPQVEGDATQLHQVVMNLATNAWQAMEETGGRLAIRLSETELDSNDVERMPGLAEGRYLLLEVEDDGIGMDPAVAARVFEPFFTTKPVGEGTGLGLAVTHGIVVAHGGHIEVHSVPGRGTRFSIHLPVAGDAVPPAEATGPLDAVVIDDEASVERFIVRVLERAGWRVEGFTAPEHALASLEERAEIGSLPDVVLSDQTMPDVSGVAVAERVHALAPGVPIVLMSGYERMLSEEAMEAIGVADFLRKPFLGRQLLDVMERVAAESRGRGSPRRAV